MLTAFLTHFSFGKVCQVQRDNLSSFSGSRAYIYDAAIYDGYINQKILQLHLSQGVRIACTFFYTFALSTLSLPPLSLPLSCPLSLLPYAVFASARKRIKCAFAALNCRHSTLQPPAHSPARRTACCGKFSSHFTSNYSGPAREEPERATTSPTVARGIVMLP